MVDSVDIPIRHKGSQTAGYVPSVADILSRQLFINLQDRRLFTKDENNVIIPLGVVAADFSSVAFSGQYEDLSGKPTIPTQYTLPAATQTLLGGITVGDGLSVSMGLVSTVIRSLRGEFGLTKEGDVVLTRSDLGLDILDANDVIRPQYLPSSVTGAITYIDLWDASTNTPAIPAAGAGNIGWLYVCGVAGTTDIDGNDQWNVGDQLLSNGTVWQRIPFIASAVINVNGQTGAVSLNANNLPGLSQVGKTGQYTDLLGTPVLGAVATSNNYDDLDNLPALGPVATSNQYADLTGLPPNPTFTDISSMVYSTNGSAVLAPYEYVFTRPMRFGINFAESQAVGRTITGTQIQVRIMKAVAATPTTFTQVGTLTITISGGAQTASFTTSTPNPVDFAAGDVLRYEWVQTNASSLSISLHATRL